MSEGTKNILLTAFDGWNDAAQSATNTIHHLIQHYKSREICRIDGNNFYDYQRTRPMICHAAGRTDIVWPQTSFFEIALTRRFHVFAQIAPEPNYNWQEYCSRCFAIADELEVDRIISLGSMFTASPHTRPMATVWDTGHCECNADHAYNGPVGITTVFDRAAEEHGFEHASLWVSIPDYMSRDDCPPGTLALLQELSHVFDVELDACDLYEKSLEWTTRGDCIMRNDSELERYIHSLEDEYDLRKEAEQIVTEHASQVEQLVEETENFLRDINE